MAKTKITPVKVTKGKAKLVLAKPAKAVVKTKKVIPVAKTKIIDTSKKAKLVDPVVVQKALKARKVTAVANMTLSELKAKRIEIAEQVIASGVHWIEENGQLVSVLDQTDYWKVKALVEKKK